jgi:hypothetical protein
MGERNRVTMTAALRPSLRILTASLTGALVPVLVLSDHFYLALSICSVAFYLLTPRSSRLRDIAQIMMNVTLIFSYIITRPMFWQNDRLVGTDFPAFYSGGALIREAPHKLYDEQMQITTQRATAGQHLSEPSDFLPFAYLPAVALVFAPYTFLSYTNAYLAWNTTNLVLLAIILFALLKHFRIEPGNGSLILSITVLAPVYAALGNGQTSFMVLLLFAATIMDWRKAKTTRAAVWAGMLIIKQTLFPVLLFWFVLQRRWKELGVALTTAAALFGVSTLLVGMDGMHGWWDISQKMAKGQFATTGQLHMENLRAVAVRLGMGDGFWLCMVALVLAGMSLAFLFGRMTEAARYSVLIVTSLLVAPHLHMHDVILTTILLMFLFARGITAWNKWTFLVIILVEAMWISPLGAGGLWIPIVPLALAGFFTYLVVQSLWNRDSSYWFLSKRTEMSSS